MIFLRVVYATKLLMHSVMVDNLQDRKPYSTQREIFNITNIWVVQLNLINTLISVTSIVQKWQVILKYLKFVFFYDHLYNDFNTRFTPLPANKSLLCCSCCYGIFLRLCFSQRISPYCQLHLWSLFPFQCSKWGWRQK